MSRKITFATLLLVGTAVAGLSLAQGTANPAVGARQAHMRLLSANLGVLGAMAQDNMPYDADAAAAAAANLVAIAGLDQRNYWPQGTATGEIEGTRALAEIWANIPDVMSKNADLQAAAAAMAAAAGTDLDALKAAMGPLGGACGACHRAYRQPE